MVVNLHGLPKIRGFIPAPSLQQRTGRGSGIFKPGWVDRRGVSIAPYR